MVAKHPMNLGNLGGHLYSNTMPTELINLFAGETEQSMIGPVQQAVWYLVSRGLVYIDYLQDNKFHWKIVITDMGIKAANDEEPNPDFVDLYLTQLHSKAPNISDIVYRYAREGCLNYTNQCFLSSSVMLGVASEAAFIEMANSFAKWKNIQDGEVYGRLINNPTRSLNDKFKQFRNKLEPNRKDLPRDLEDNLTLTLDSILDLLRIARNDSGHPTGRSVSADDVRMHLVIFGSYLSRIYGLKKVFDDQPK